ncbi:MerR family transcriptional regulator [Fusobacterium sp.]|uniref:MerR family transcriptional regulator n=1 Tax=Fusobacterium sp. TaxID=68766 RepID=UPI0026381DC1|nr:MerR family transcriptional regulator [Fusobacterium sp.]
MNKKNENLLTVSEVAEVLGINKNTILHYDREGVIKAIRNENNYRFYNEEKIKNFKFILKLRKLGFSLKTIKIIEKYISEKNYVAILEIMKNKINENKNKIEEIEKDMKVLESNKKYLEYLNDLFKNEDIHLEKEPENFFCIKTCKEERGIFIDVEDVEKNFETQKRFVEKELKKYKKDFNWLKKQFFGKGISKKNILIKNYQCDIFIIKADIENYPNKYFFPEGEYAFLYLKKDYPKNLIINDFLKKIKIKNYEIAGDLFIEDVSLFAEDKNESVVKILKFPIKHLTSE